MMFYAIIVRMKKLLFYFILTVTPLKLISQSCIEDLESPIKQIVQTHNKDFIFLSGNFKLTKLNSELDTIWDTEQYDSSNMGLNKIIQTYDGKYMGVGSAQNSNYLFKINSVGDTLWTKPVKLFSPGPFGGAAQVVDIIQTADSGFVFAALTGMMQTNAMIIKTNKMGDTLWTKKRIMYNHSETGVYDNIVKKILELPDGSLLISGYMEEYLAVQRQMKKFSYLYRLNASGDSMNLKIFHHYRFNKLKIDKTGNIIIASAKLNDNETRKATAFKTTIKGDSIWAIEYKGDEFYNVTIAKDGSYLFVGDYIEDDISNMYLASIKGSGDLNWSVTHFHDSILNKRLLNVFPNSDTGFIAFGGSPKFNNRAPLDFDCKIELNLLGKCMNMTLNKKKKRVMASIYPNPTTGQIHVDLKNGLCNPNIKIFDSKGILIKQSKALDLDLYEYNIGLYLLEIEINGIKEVHKILKL